LELQLMTTGGVETATYDYRPRADGGSACGCVLAVLCARTDTQGTGEP
jgi:hypothetical protein